MPNSPHDTPAADLVVIAIDGPAGSGKSTVARRLADEVGLEYLDTGAMYRSVTLAALNAGIDPQNQDAIAALASDLILEVMADGLVLLNGADVTAAIRSSAVNESVSAVAAIAEVRAQLVERQRRWARTRSGGVMEGRDIGSVVFPDAILKVYLTADPEIRAARRAREIPTEAGEIAVVAADMARRDKADSSREHDPLSMADDALVVDTSFLSVDEVVALLAAVVRNSLGNDSDEG